MGINNGSYNKPSNMVRGAGVEMSREEFIKTCILCGYASRKNAKKYVQGKKTFSEDDLIEVFRINERQNDLKNGVMTYNRVSKVTGDYLINSLNRRPEPWNHIFDASRGRDIGQVRRSNNDKG